MKKAVEWIVKNWDKIPDKYKSDIHGVSWNYAGSDIDGLSKEEHFVVLLLDRQKPSVEASYDFDEERIGVNKNGKIIWGFDSGCSCPSPWVDSYPGCYNVAKEWKEFELDAEKFDVDWEKECLKKLDEIKNALR